MILPKITGVILAGGRGSRMGHIDKGLQLFRGKPLVAHAIERLAPQVDELLINANRNLGEYEKYGYRVIADSIEGFPGPLAGFECGLAAATSELVVTAPCDSPFLPADLVSRLMAVMEKNNAGLAVAKTGDQLHSVFCLMKRSVLPSLRAYLRAGERKIDLWHEVLQVVIVNFDDEEEAFRNINTLEEKNALE
jgi:molybdopterin-guanine dinucleotide biosynthesis protein A